MFVKFISIFILISLMPNLSLQDYITSIIKEFNLNNPYLVGSVEVKNIDLIKLLSKHDHFLKIYSIIEEFSFNKDVTTNAIAFLNFKRNQSDENYYHLSLPKSPFHSLLLISNNENFEELLGKLSIQTSVNQKVFIFNNDTQEIYETYTVNNIIVKRKLGHIDSNSNNFKWNKNVNPNFIQRRSDFHGLVLKGMVEFTGLNMNADSSYLEKAQYFPNNETYLVTDFTYGLFHDVLLILQEKLNFTTELYKRKELIWGHIYPLNNGSYEGTGIIGDIFFERADICVAATSIHITRAHYIDFLPPLQPKLAEIYIPNSNTESIDFNTYTTPFTHDLWMTVVIAGILFATLKLFLLKVHENEKAFGFDDIWTTFSGFLGGKPNPTPIDSNSYYRVTILVTLLCSTVVWMAYRAHLSAELAISQKKYPFYDMEGFSKTNWR